MVWDKVGQDLTHFYRVCLRLCNFFQTHFFQTPQVGYKRVKGTRSSYFDALAPHMVKKYGLKKMKKIGIIALIITCIGIVCFLITLNHYSFIFIIMALVGLYLTFNFLGSHSYYNRTKCAKCGGEFSFKQERYVDVMLVPVTDGTDRYTTRTYRCSKCGYESKEEDKTFMVDPAIRV